MTHILRHTFMRSIACITTGLLAYSTAQAETSSTSTSSASAGPLHTQAWHNIAKIGMLNPCIIAPSTISIKPTQPLHLHYRIVTFDGPTPTSLLDQLSKEFSQ